MNFFCTRFVATLCGILILMLTVCGCSKAAQEKGGAKIVASGNGIVTISTLLATSENLVYSDKESQQHMPKNEVVFSEQGRGVAYISQEFDKSIVVHNGKAGKAYQEISHLTISPDGKRVAFAFKFGDKLRMVVDGIEGPIFDDVWDSFYSPDSRHIAYIAQVNEKSLLVIDGKMGEEFKSFIGNPLFSAESNAIIFCASSLYKNSAQIVISDLAGKTKIVKECIATPFAINAAKSRIAIVTEESGMLRLTDFAIAQPDVVTKGAWYEMIHSISFGDDGSSVSYIGNRGGKRYLVVNKEEESLPDNMVLAGEPRMRPDFKGGGIILTTNERSGGSHYLYQTGKKGGATSKTYSKAKELVYNKATGFTAYVAFEGERCFVVINGKEGPTYDMIATPMFSPDGTRLVYRARKGGKRFVVVADADGKVIRQHPEYEMVFQTVFTPDGKSVAYGVKNGNELWWKVEKL